MEWVPERVGNWLFHCHVMAHVAPERRLGASPSGDPAGGYIGDSGQTHGAAHGAWRPPASTTNTPRTAVHDPADPSLGMAGMVLGITVTRPRRRAGGSAGRDAATPRQLTMTIHGPSADGATAAGDHVTEDGAPAATRRRGASPGPPVVLRRGEPVEITLVNQLAESTSMHWHGLELDSYYDGVHGWSGARPEGRADDRARRALHRPHHAAAHRHVHLPHAPARLPAAVVGTLRAAGRRRARRDLRPGHRSRRRARPARRGAGRGDPEGSGLGGDRRRARAALDVGGEDAAPAAPDQHHARRHLVGVADRRGRPGDVAAADQGRRGACPASEARPARRA